MKRTGHRSLSGKSPADTDKRLTLTALFEGSARKGQTIINKHHSRNGRKE